MSGPETKKAGFRAKKRIWGILVYDPKHLTKLARDGCCTHNQEYTIVAKSWGSKGDARFCPSAAGVLDTGHGIIKKKVVTLCVPIGSLVVPFWDYLIGF